MRKNTCELSEAAIIANAAIVTYELDLRIALKDNLIVVLDCRELLLGDFNLCSREIVDLAFLDHLVKVIDLLIESCDLDLALWL